MVAKNVLYFFVKGLAFCILILCPLVKFGLAQIELLSIALVVLQILLIIEYRKFKPLAFLVLFTLPYTLVAHWYFSNPEFTLLVGSRTDFDNQFFYTGVFIIISIFWSIITIFLPKLKRPLVLKNYILVKKHPFIFYSILCLQVFIILFGRTGNTIFQSGGYGSEDANMSNLGGTAIFEYFLVLYPVAYFFSGREKRKIAFLLTVGALYSMKAVLFGGRVEMLQLLLLVFILHFDNIRTSLFKILIIAIPAVIFFILLGVLRGAPEIGIAGAFEVLKENFGLIKYTVFANHIDVYYSSTRLYGFCNIGILSDYERVKIFFYNVLAVVVPYGALPPEANLAAFKQDDYPAGGGGLVPVYFFIYLGYFGVIMIAIILGLFLRKIIKNTHSVSMYFLVYMIMILSTYPRWYAYSANVIYKFCLYAVIVLFFANMASRYLQKKNKYSYIGK